MRQRITHSALTHHRTGRLPARRAGAASPEIRRLALAYRRRVHRASYAVRAFSLLEALAASVILGLAVIALSSAIAAGQKASLEGQKMVLGAMVADDLLAELSTVPYAELVNYHGVEQDIGEMATIDAIAYPPSAWLIGRRIDVVEEIVEAPGLEVKIKGQRITVTAFDEEKTVASAELFIPEPAE